MDADEREADARNPYAAPREQAGYRGAGEGTPLDVALYTARHVGLATFVGTPLGGAVVMAVNEQRFGRTAAAINMLLGGFVATGFLLTIGFLLPDNVPSFPIAIVSLVAMAAFARSRQGARVTQHLAAGGKRGSGWAAAGIGILSLVVVLVPLAAIFVLADASAGR